MERRHLSWQRGICPRYMYFCDKWNNYSDFSKSKSVATEIQGKVSSCYLESDFADQHGNRRWNLADKHQIIDVVNKILAVDDNTIVHLPFDQSAGLLLNLLNRTELREDFRSIFSFPEQGASPPSPYACVHIRRGDCTPHSHPLWHVENGFYLQLLELILAHLPRSYRIYVCTQGDVSWLNSIGQSSSFDCERLVVRSTDQLFINDSEVEDFILMKNASILFGASSSFSRWASYLGRQRLVVDISRFGSHALRDAVVINPDSPIADSMLRIKELLDIF